MEMMQAGSQHFTMWCAIRWGW